MGSSDKFCLRWNDFESNISAALSDLRQDKDFFDVTLASEDDKQIMAHKLILSACSPFFRRILKRHASSTPFASPPILYLKGVRYSELVAVLNFMYHGEVNVAQDELNSFLAVAEELSVKGLTTSAGGVQGHSSTRKATSQQGAPAPKKMKTTTVSEVSIKAEPKGQEVDEDDIEQHNAAAEEDEEGAFDYTDFDNGQEYDDSENMVDPIGPVSGATKAILPYTVIQEGTNRGANLYVADGYHFVKRVTVGKKIHLKCRRSYLHKCKVTATIDPTHDVFVVKGIHPHDRELLTAEEYASARESRFKMGHC